VGGAMRRHLHCSEPRTSQQPGEGVLNRPGFAGGPTC
jgi:hypothetical protein